MMKKLIIAALALLLTSGAMAQERLVVAGGSLVELLYALGAGDTLVGVDETTSYPPETKALPHIGYWKQLSAEGILSLVPTTFITWQDAEPKLVLNQLAQQKVKVLTLPRTPATVERMYSNIHTLATSVNKTAQGDELVASLQQRLAAAAQKNQQIAKPVRVMFLLSPGGGVPQIAGTESVAGTILSLAGGQNIASHAEYKTYSGEAIIAANPDVIVVTTQSLAAADGKKQLGNVAGVTRTAAWKNQRIVEIDQSLILGMGPRIVDAVEFLQQQLYPNPA